MDSRSSEREARAAEPASSGNRRLRDPSNAADGGRCAFRVSDHTRNIEPVARLQRRSVTAVLPGALRRPRCRRLGKNPAAAAELRERACAVDELFRVSFPLS
jgi:hypothetical protein